MPCSFVELSLKERRRITQLPRHKVRVPSIAEALGRHRSTIYREIRRNSWHDQEVPGDHRLLAGDGAKAEDLDLPRGIGRFVIP